MLKPFKNDIATTIQRHLISMHELIQLTTDLNLMHIDYIALKGAPLNQLLYGDNLVRVSRDMDILIQIKDIQSAHHYLVDRGYELQLPFSMAHLSCKPSGLINYLDEILYWHPLKHIALDLKWHTSSLNRFGMSWCDIKNHTVIHMNAHPIKMLNAEENFYYLCMHAAKHRWEYRQWLEDLAVFSQKIHFCWDTVISLAESTQAIRPLLEASLLLKEQFHIQLKDIPYSFWDKMVVKIRLYFIGSNWFGGLKNKTKSKWYFSAILSLCLYPKIPQKCHYIKRLLVLRVSSLRHINRFKNPKPYKMILFSFLPVGNKFR